MRKILFHPWMMWILRVGVALLLLYAGVKKIWMPLEFARLIREYHLLPDYLLNLVAVILPWTEVVCALSFISGLWLVGAAFLLSVMNTIFAFAITYRAWLLMSDKSIGFFDVSFDCGCGFGVVYIPTKILENLILAGIGILILIYKKGLRSTTI